MAQGGGISVYIGTRLTSVIAAVAQALGRSPAPTVTAESGTFPLAASSNGRYLETAGGDQFYAIVDSPQGLFVNLAPTDNATDHDVGAYLSVRQSQGFNGLWSNIICGVSTGGRGDASTYDGLTPFTGSVGGGPDFTTPRESYWQRVDAIIDLITAYGFLLYFNPAETIWFIDALAANGAARCNTYGQWLGSRYGHLQNVIWLQGNDYQSWPDQDTEIGALMDGIRATDPDSLQTIQLSFNNSDSFDDANFIPRVDLNAVYAYDPQYQQFRIAYNRADHVPVFYMEGSYENEDLSNAPPGVPIEIRRQLYWGLTNGATGNLYGEHSIWTMDTTGWEDYLVPPNAPATAHITRFTELLDTVAWHTLVPDQSNAFLTAGQGTYTTDSYATAALSADGTLALVYKPSAANVTLDLTQMSGPVDAQWFDPADGSYASAGTGLTGSHVFTHPGGNSDGDVDWVLLLES